MAEEVKKRRLGRGLDALMGDSQIFLDQENTEIIQKTLSIGHIGANRYNPRQYFDETDLDDLSKSIAEKGVLQPILVRAVADREYIYEIVAGERRWRASKLAGKSSIPTIIVDLNDKEALEVAIIENVQRENLSAIEEAVGLGQLIEQFDYTQDDVAKVIGKSRSYVTNLLRLLKLPDDIKHMVERGDISAGHARALLGRENATELAKQVIDDGLSVRDIEGLVRKQEGRDAPITPAEKITETKVVKVKSSQTIALEHKLSEAIGGIVNVDYNDNGKGSVKILFGSLAQFEDICKRIGG